MNNNIKCLNPTIILNVQFVKWVLRSKSYIYKNQVYPLMDWSIQKWECKFPYKLFSYYRYSVNIDDLDGCYTYNDDGEIIPMFLVVPCGHCELCNKRRRDDWSTRCLCESQNYNHPPHFLTLTYNNKHLPKDGVNKHDCQLFLKRLRSQLVRDGYESPRYFLVAEYGSKSGRPHYHALIWNMPFIPQWEILKYFERAWSICLDKKNNIFDPIGFVHCSVAADCCGAYVMKYMSKDGFVPKGMNETFYTSSRRRGIGYSYVAAHQDEVYDNLDIFSFHVTDKFTGKVYNFALPSYFKRVLFPCPSSFTKKDFRDTVKLFMVIEHEKLYFEEDTLGNPSPDYSRYDYVKTQFCDRFNIYDYGLDKTDLKIPRFRAAHKALKFYNQLDQFSNLLYKKIYQPLCDISSKYYIIDDIAFKKAKRLMYASLLDIEFNVESIINKINRKKQHYLEMEKL